MQEYSIKRGLDKKTGRNLEERMIGGLEEFFEISPGKAGDHAAISYGALKRLEVWTGPAGKTLCIDTESDMEAGDEVILDTNRRFRKYLEHVTGFTAKERSKKMQKS